MILLETVQVAFAMFSAIPMPQPVWNEKNMRYALCAFPLIGIACGVSWWVWCSVCGFLALPVFLRGAGLCILPVLITGGIHLDGYADTCDALASHAEPAKKQEILKDPRCGAFAVIRLLVYFTAYLALCAAFEPTPRALLCMGCAFVMERAMSGFAITRFRLAKNTGLAHTFATAADQKTAALILMGIYILAALGLLVFGFAVGAAMIFMGVYRLWQYRMVAVREFGGISGDLAGWFLQKTELWTLGVLVLCQRTPFGGWI